MPKRVSAKSLANLNRGYIKPRKTTKSVTLELEAEMVDAIDAAAKSKEISRAAEIRDRLEKYQRINQQKEEKS